MHHNYKILPSILLKAQLSFAFQYAPKKFLIRKFFLQLKYEKCFIGFYLLRALAILCYKLIL